MSSRRREVLVRWAVLLVLVVSLGVALAYLVGVARSYGGVYGVAFVGGWFAGVWLIGDYRDHVAARERLAAARRERRHGLSRGR